MQDLRTRTHLNYAAEAQLDADELVNEFGSYIEEGAAGVFVGAGISIGAGYPSWPTLMEPFARELELTELDDLPQIAQFFQDTVPGGRDRLTQGIYDALQAVESSGPTQAHNLIGQLPIDTIWTTNYDTLLEEARPQAVVIDTDEQLAGRLAADSRYLTYKMHGTIRPGPPSALRLTDHVRIVISRDDYDLYPVSHPRLWSLLQAHFLTKTFLLLGLSFTDPNLLHIFRLIRLMKSGTRRPHFAVMRRPEKGSDRRLHSLKLAELERVGVRTLEIDGFEEIDDLLRNIVCRARPLRAFIAGSPVGVSTKGGAKTYSSAQIPTDLKSFTTQLGALMATENIKLMAAGAIGAHVGYEMARQQTLQGRYEYDSFILVRRALDDEVDYPNLRMGTIVFSASDQPNLRAMAFDQVRAVIMLAGQRGSYLESQQARELQLGLIPVGMTGGSARKVWREIDDDFLNYRLGGRAVSRLDFNLLMERNEHAAALATIRLV